MSRNLSKCILQLGRSRTIPQRYFHNYPATREEDSTQTQQSNIKDRVASILSSASFGQGGTQSNQLLKSVDTYGLAKELQASQYREPHHVHIYAHKHNLHITLTRPNGEPMLSMSTGKIGFKGHNRGSYEAAFQLSAFALRTMADRGYYSNVHPDYITKCELIFRGWGQGRQAFQAALLGVEGKLLRPTIIKLSDSTRLKIGGNRAPNPRRL